MRRINDQPTNSDLATVTLYRQDLDAIVEALHSADGKATYIADDAYVFENLDEVLQERGTKVHSLKIGYGRTRLEFEPTSISLGGSEHSPELLLIRGILTRNARWFGGTSPLLAAVASLVGVVLLIVLIIITAVIGPHVVVLGVMLPVTAIVALTYWLLPPRTRLFLVRRHEHQTFWKRHESEVVKAALALGGGAAGYLLRVLHEWYTRQP